MPVSRRGWHCRGWHHRPPGLRSRRRRVRRTPASVRGLVAGAASRARQALAGKTAPARARAGDRTGGRRAAARAAPCGRCPRAAPGVPAATRLSCLASPQGGQGLGLFGRIGALARQREHADASTAISSAISDASRARSFLLIESLPPPAGSTKPCAQPSTGAATGVSARPFSVAVQPPYGSASTRVPPAAGALTPLMPTGLAASVVTVPSAATTRARATGPVTCHKS